MGDLNRALHFKTTSNSKVHVEALQLSMHISSLTHIEFILLFKFSIDLTPAIIAFRLNRYTTVSPQNIHYISRHLTHFTTLEGRRIEMERDGPVGVTRVLHLVQAELVAHVGDVVGLGLGRALLDHGALCRRVGALLNLVGPVKPDLKKLVSGSGVRLDGFRSLFSGEVFALCEAWIVKTARRALIFARLIFFVLLQRFLRPFADSSLDIDLLFDDFV